jgi:hypothetical protein
LIELARSKMRSLGPETATKFTTMDAMVSSSIATPRLRMMLAVLFAGLALLPAPIRSWHCATSKAADDVSLAAAYGCQLSEGPHHPGR